MKTDTAITQTRIQSARQSVFNPIANLTPASLVTAINSWKAGYLSTLAYVFEKIEESDYNLQTDAPKRYKSVARVPWEVVVIDGHQDNPEAARHAAALRYFYNNVTCRDALEPQKRGGFPMLVRTMARAIGHRYACHDIAWRPQAPVWDGDQSAPVLRRGLAAEFTSVPVYFFESTTGVLRFVREPWGVNGVEMVDGEWLVTVADGLLLSSAICWMYKTLAFKDWVIYNGKFGIPGIHGKTDATKDSTEWNDFVEAVEDFANDWYAVTNRSGEIALLKAEGGGATLPMERLVDRMETAITRMWRGGDLASQSGKADAVGALAQAGETAILNEDDCEVVSETLQTQIDPHVIRWYFGAEVSPLAYVQVRIPDRKNTDADLKIDAFLRDSGVRLASQPTAERYGRTAAPAEEPDVLTRPAPAPSPFAVNAATANDGEGPSGPPRPPSDSRRAARRESREGSRGAPLPSLLAASRAALVKAQGAALAPLRDRLRVAAALDDAVALRAELEEIRAELPALLARMNANPETATVIEESIAAALLTGATEGKR